MTEEPEHLIATPGAEERAVSLVGGSTVLREALERLRLTGAIFFHSVFRAPYAIDATPNQVAALLHPGAERLVLFHIVADGHVWITDARGDRHYAASGDVVVFPYGDDHRFSSDDPTEPVLMLSLFDPPPWDRMPFLQYGDTGEATRIVCGYLVSDDPLFDPRLGAFPSAFVVRPADDALAQWVRASVDYAMQETGRATDGASDVPTVIATRLPELVVIEVLKDYLSTLPAMREGWLAALRDPVLAPALAVLHESPGRRWTVADIAAEVAVSRSVLDERFREVLGRSPIRYLAEWRMHLAEELLASTDTTIFAIARRVGYDSEEAFSRAFKRGRGSAPSQWRARRRPTA